jgi:hypothetical protein
VQGADQVWAIRELPSLASYLSFFLAFSAKNLSIKMIACAACVGYHSGIDFVSNPGHSA